MTSIEFRSHLHDMWSAVAGGWAEHAGYADTRSAPLTARMLELTDPRPGERVLELACGPGGLGLAAARRGCEVVLSDVAPEMVEIAAARAEGLANVSPRVLDLEDIDEPDGAYDVVLCREGLMFATDPGHAVDELRRVGGRVGVAVWGPRERNPWLGVVLDAAAGVLGRAVPPPGVPGPFSLADGALLRERFDTVEEVEVPLRASSFDEWLTRTMALAGPIATLVGPDALREPLREAAAPYVTTAGIEFPGVALLAT